MTERVYANCNSNRIMDHVNFTLWRWIIRTCTLSVTLNRPNSLLLNIWRTEIILNSFFHFIFHSKNAYVRYVHVDWYHIPDCLPLSSISPGKQLLKCCINLIECYHCFQSIFDIFKFFIIFWWNIIENSHTQPHQYYLRKYILGSIENPF